MKRKLETLIDFYTGAGIAAFVIGWIVAVSLWLSRVL